MKMGTKSLLYGAHAFYLHPFFVAFAWWKLFGAPLDPRLWIAFIVHDIGYFGSPEMDGPIGERHPELGARIMGWLFGPEWASFTIRHSRTYARLEGMPVSALCAADKLSMVIEPKWFYLFRVKLSGEVDEYVALNAEKGYNAPGDTEGWYDSTISIVGAKALSIAEQVKYGTGDIHRASAAE